ncbi:MAG: hypothetical protein IJ229_09760, partial [Clostridia bacterium]|nr:hypothetical protein [Clostridia bacterium]
LEITLGEVDGAVSYWVALEDANGEVLTRNASDAAGRVYLSSALAEAGTYKVRAWVRDEERNDGLPNQDTTVTVKAYTGNSVVIRTPKTDVYVGEYVYISVYAPDATAVKVYDPQQPDADWWGSDSNIWVSSMDFFQESGNATLYAEAYGADGSVVKSENLHFTVTEKGKIGDPIMSLVDGIYPAQENIEVKYAFENSKNIDGVDIVYGYSVFDWNADRKKLFDTEKLASSGTFTVDGSLLEEGGTYIVELYAYSKEKGYKTPYIDRKIMVPNPGDDRLSLTSRGKTELTVLTNEDVPLTIHAPGATAIHLFKGDVDDWDYWGDAEGFWDDIPYTMSWGNSDTMILFLEVCYDKDFEDDEHVTWVYSDPLVIHVTTTQGSLSAPVIDHMPGEVTVGSVLQVPAVKDEHAEWAWLDVFARGEDGNLNWDEVLSHSDLNDDGVFYVNTAKLTPGEVYCAVVGCGATGWKNSSGTYRWFTAKGNAVTQPLFEANKTNLETFESFSVTGYVPGADELRIYADGNPDDEWGYWGEDAFSGANWWFDHAGEHSLTLAACVNGEWNDVTTLAFTVSAPHGQMQASQIELPLEIAFGEDLEIVFPEVAHATYYHYRLEIEAGAYIGESQRKTPGSLVIHHEDLQEGQVYRIFLDVSAQGYENYHQEHCVMIGYAEGRGWIDNPTNTLTLRNAKTELETGEVMPLTAYAPGAMGIQLWVNGILQDERFGVTG